MSKTLLPECTKCVFLSVILQNFPGGMPLDSPRMVVPSALPLNLICDETWPPPRKFSAYATEDEILHTTSFFYVVIIRAFLSCSFLHLWFMFGFAVCCRMANSLCGSSRAVQHPFIVNVPRLSPLLTNACRLHGSGCAWLHENTGQISFFLGFAQFPVQ